MLRGSRHIILQAGGIIQACFTQEVNEIFKLAGDGGFEPPIPISKTGALGQLC